MSSFLGRIPRFDQEYQNSSVRFTATRRDPSSRPQKDTEAGRSDDILPESGTGRLPPRRPRPDFAPVPSSIPPRPRPSARTAVHPQPYRSKLFSESRPPRQVQHLSTRGSPSEMPPLVQPTPPQMPLSFGHLPKPPT